MQFKAVFDAIRHLMHRPSPKKRKIRFLVKERAHLRQSLVVRYFDVLRIIKTCKFRQEREHDHESRSRPFSAPRARWFPLGRNADLDYYLTGRCGEPGELNSFAFTLWIHDHVHGFFAFILQEVLPSLSFEMPASLLSYPDHWQFQN